MPAERSPSGTRRQACAPRRQQTKAERIDHDQDARAFEGRVDKALHTRVGQIERVERAGEDAEACKRQHGEYAKDPGGGERAPQSAWDRPAPFPIDESSRDPAKRSGGQQERDDDRRHADFLGKRWPSLDDADPVVDEIAHDGGVERDLFAYSRPKPRIENARRASERSRSEHLAPRRADARAQIIGFEQHGARGAQVCVDPVVPLLLVLEVLGGDVCCGRRGWPALGVSSSRRLTEAASRGSVSATAPCNAMASASLWARRACNFASSRSCPEAPFPWRSASPASRRG